MYVRLKILNIKHHKTTFSLRVGNTAVIRLISKLVSSWLHVQSIYTYIHTHTPPCTPHILTHIPPGALKMNKKNKISG